jgi:hypothetical protein
MSRSGNVDVVTVKPANNIYTALTFVAFLIVLGALYALYAAAKTEFGANGLF